MKILVEYLLYWFLQTNIKIGSRSTVSPYILERILTEVSFVLILLYQKCF